MNNLGFRVELKFPFDDNFMETTERAIEAAQHPSSDGGVGFGVRDLGWIVHDFEKAIQIRASLIEAGFESVVIREQ